RPDKPIPSWLRRLYRRAPALQKLVRLGLYALREASVMLFRHPAAMRQVQRLAERHLRRTIADPALRARLLPSYRMGCKRILLSDDYYPALAQPNVDVLTGGIAEVRAHSIVGGDGIERPVDAI